MTSDPRWTAFNSKGFQCSCGEKHVGLFPIHIEVPIGWPHARVAARDEDLQLDGDFLSSSYCVMGGRYFALRCRLPIQIAGEQPAAFMYTAWASLDRQDFEGYLRAKQANLLRKTAGARARLVNRLSAFPDTSDLMGTAFQQEDGGWPILVLHGLQINARANHVLMKEQHEGIGMDRVLDLFAAYGHDMKAAAR